MITLPPVSKLINGLLFTLVLITLFSLMLVMPTKAKAQTAPGLGSATRFAVLGGAAVTNTGASVVTGDLGVSPGTSVTGFPPGMVTGAIHSADSEASSAQTDSANAYNSLAGEACNQDLTSQDLGGKTLLGGVYCFSSSAQLTGEVTLDAGGNADAVFVFQIGSTLTTASNASVRLINGGNACNIWWQVGSSATLGTDTSFRGSILALASITLNTDANIVGRTFAQTGAVTMDSNNVNASKCAASPASRPELSLDKRDNQSDYQPGDTIHYTLRYKNSGNIAFDSVMLTDTIPTGTTFNGTAGWNCASSPCTFDLGQVMAGARGSVDFDVTVDDGMNGTISNGASIASGATSATDTVSTLLHVDTSGNDDNDSNDDSDNNDSDSNNGGSGATDTGMTTGSEIDTTVGGTSPTAAAPFVQAPVGARDVQVSNIQALTGAGGQSSASGNNSNAQSVSGVPNTGGGPPQPMYWLSDPNR